MRKGTSTASSSRIYLASAETTLKRVVIWRESFRSWVCASSPSTIIMTVQRKSDDKGRILIPFNNLINDTYCRDISLRVRSHLDVKRKEGQFIGSFAGYGYRKDPKDKNHLIIDEYAAGIVQEIFKLKLNGMSSQHIASHLNELGVLPPNEYKRANGV